MSSERKPSATTNAAAASATAEAGGPSSSTPSFHYWEAAANATDAEDDDTLRNVEPWTDQDEQAEIAALVQAEVAKIRSDLHGLQLPLAQAGGLPSAAEDVEGSMKSIGQTILRDPSSALSTSILARLDQEVFNLLSTASAAAAAGGLHGQEGGRSASSQAVAQAAATAYLSAAQRCPEQVNDIRRKVACLVHANGKATDAARMIVQYWHHRVELFGPDSAYLPMTLGGALRHEVLDLSNRHIWHVLPVPDAAGRTVLYCKPANRNLGQYGVDRELRTLWYLLETIAEDDVSNTNNNRLDRRGVVFLYDATNLEWEHTSKRLDQYLGILSGIFPVPFRAFHVCCFEKRSGEGETASATSYPSDSISSSIVRAMHRLLPKHIRLRLKMHRGSALQALQSLSSVALPVDRIPSDLGGRLVVNMGHWMVNRISVENMRVQQQQQQQQQQMVGPIAALPTFLARSNPPPPAIPSNPGLEHHLLLSGSALPSSNSVPAVQPPFGNALVETLLEQIAASQAADTVSSLGGRHGLPVAGTNNASAESLVAALQPGASSSQGTAATASASSIDGGFSGAEPVASRKRIPARGRGVRNPQMDRAVELKLANPEMSHFDVLVDAGFVFRAREGGATGMVCEGESRKPAFSFFA